MAYTALYRKYRPDTFENVIGQDHIVRTLKNQVLSGRVSHAYLFAVQEVQERRLLQKYLQR